tara:strand:+ start:8126 stop:8614 length:489 start_codon:yes stop_codon:yes gene_type:complete
MELTGIDGHPLKDKFPCRLPVWWGYVGEPGSHPDIRGITGRRVVLRIQKRFTRIERLLAKILKAPKEVRRPLDSMNSLLWELCDGKNSFGHICKILDSIFHEDISPVVERTRRGIEHLKSQNLLTILDQEFNGKWDIGIGKTPINQTLGELDPALGIDLGEE